jgi:acyl-coenzyme A synthetase/AMP-(fatty) acid ligase
MGATLALLFKQPLMPSDREHKVRLAWGVPVPSWGLDYERRFGHPIAELYGSVEAGLPVMQTGERVPGSCGRVLSGYTVQISDEFDMPVPANTIGNILVRSTRPNAFFKGYLNAPTQTIAATENLWLHTGDLGRIDEEDNMYFHGRVKDVIRRRGENVNAFEVEEEFLRHPNVVTAAAIAIPAELGRARRMTLKLLLS